MFWEIVGFLLLVVSYVMYTALAPVDTKKRSGGDWNGFIGKADPKRVAEIKAKEDASRVGDEEFIKVYNKPGRQLLLLYGSEYGFSEVVAKKLFLRLIASVNAAAGIGADVKTADGNDDNKDDADAPRIIAGVDASLQPRLVNMRDVAEYVELTKEQCVLVVCSTTGDGVPPSDARKFVDDLCESKDDLSHLRFGVLALGDSAYPHFCRTGRTVDARLKELRARELVGRVDVDLEDWGAIDSWFERAVGAVSGAIASGDVTVRDDYLSRLEPPKPPKKDGFDRNRPFTAVVTAKRNLTKAAPEGKAKDDKETIHIEFDLADSKLAYVPGDALGVCPLNNPPAVAALLKVLGLNDGSRRVPSPLKKRDGDTEYDPMPSVASVLLSYYDLKKVRAELVAALAPFVTNAEQKKNITDLLAAGLSKSNAALHEFLKNREALDVFEAFSSAIGGATGANGGSSRGSAGGIPLDKVLANLRPLQPRYYSIASCPQTTEGKVQLCVAIVRYQTHGRQRTGTATTYMQDRIAVGQRVPIFVSVNHEFRLPSDPRKPIIMIGPGTGLAPFRAFIQNRLLSGATGTNTLYFGCRSRHIDYLYGDLLEEWSAKGAIALRTAFSRDQKEKVYVQHLIEQDAQRIWTALNDDGAHLYVCGDGANMAADVHKAFVEMAMRFGNLSADAAERYFDALLKGKRYQRDVWIT